MSEQRYARIYHSAPDDPRFATIWNDDACLALWTRLLVAADMAWPASAAVPRRAKSRPLAVIVASGLVELLTGDRFRLHGMEAERMRRSNAAAYASGRRWHPDSNADRIADGNADSNADRIADGNAEMMLPDQTRPDQTRPDQTRGARMPGEDDDEDAQDVYHRLTLSRPWGRPSGAWLKRLDADFGPIRVADALTVEWRASPDMTTFLGRVEARLGREVERTRKARAKPEPQRPEIDPEVAARQRDEIARMMGAEVTR